MLIESTLLETYVLIEVRSPTDALAILLLLTLMLNMFLLMLYTFLLIPAQLVLMPFLADVETVWMPAELVATPTVLVLADVETDWMPAELVATP